MTAYRLRRHSGSLPSGRPPSEPLSFRKRATRRIISPRDHVRIVRQSLMFRLLGLLSLKLEAPLAPLPPGRGGALAPVVVFAGVGGASCNTSA